MPSKHCKRLRIFGIVAVVLGSLALMPPSASAFSLKRYRVADRGENATIVHGVTVCLGGSRRSDYLVRFRVRTELWEGNGIDLRRLSARRWLRGGYCTRVRISQPWDVVYEGYNWYGGRIRASVSHSGSVRYTRWRRFYVDDLADPGTGV